MHHLSVLRGHPLVPLQPPAGTSSAVRRGGGIPLPGASRFVVSGRFVSLSFCRRPATHQESAGTMPRASVMVTGCTQCATLGAAHESTSLLQNRKSGGQGQGLQLSIVASCCGTSAGQTNPDLSTDLSLEASRACHAVAGCWQSVRMACMWLQGACCRGRLHLHV
jgi:hypothetical protein